MLCTTSDIFGKLIDMTSKQWLALPNIISVSRGTLISSLLPQCCLYIRQTNHNDGVYKFTKNSYIHVYTLRKVILVCLYLNLIIYQKHICLYWDTRNSMYEILSNEGFLLYMSCDIHYYQYHQAISIIKTYGKWLSNHHEMI